MRSPDGKIAAFLLGRRRADRRRPRSRNLERSARRCKLLNHLASELAEPSSKSVSLASTASRSPCRPNSLRRPDRGRLPASASPTFMLGRRQGPSGRARDAQSSRRMFNNLADMQAIHPEARTPDAAGRCRRRRRRRFHPAAERLLQGSAASRCERALTDAPSKEPATTGPARLPQSGRRDRRGRGTPRSRRAAGWNERR